MTIFNWNAKTYDTAYLNQVPYAYLTPTLSGVGNTSPWIFAALEDALAQINLNVVSSSTGLVANSSTSLTIGTGSKSATITTGKTFAVGMYVDYYSASTPSAYMMGQVTAFTPGTGAITINVLNGDTGGAGTYNDWVVVVSGRKGNQGLTGLNFNWNTGTSAADPGAGLVRGNALPAAATALYIDQLDAVSVNMGSAILAWANSTSAVKGQLILRSQADLSQQIVYDVTSVTDNTGWYTIGVTYRGGAATFSANLPVMLDFSRTGDKGDTGLTGATGAGSTVFTAVNGVSVGTARPTLNLIVGGGASASAVDNAGSSRTDITINPVPTQTGNNGLYLTTNGTTTSWSAPLPTQTGNSGKYLTTNGTASSWAFYTSARSARTSNTILAAADIGTVIDVTSGTFTQTVTAAATLGSGWFCFFRNSGSGIVTIDPNASEVIDGRTTINVYPGESFEIQCNGTDFMTVGRKRKGDLVLISETTVSAVAAIDFTTAGAWTDTEFDDLLFRLDDLASASAAEWWARISTSATFQTGVNYNFTVINSNNGAAPTGSGGTGQNQFSLTSLSGQTLASVNGEIWLYNFRNATRSKNMRATLGGDRGGPAGFISHAAGNFNGNTSAWDGFRLLLSSGGNFTAQGTIQWYGRRN